MGTKLVRWFFCATFTILACSSAFGAECDSVLIPTREEGAASRTVALSYLRIIDKAEFEKLKHGGSATASIPIVDAIVNISAKYEDFQNKRTTYLEKEDFKYSEGEARSTLKTFLPEAAIKAWLECKTGINGVAIAGRSVTKESFALRLEWRPPNDVGISVADIDVSNGTIGGKSSKRVPLKGRYDKSLLVKRVPRNSDVTVTVNVGGYTDDLLIKAVIPIPPYRELLLGTIQPTARLAVFQFAENKQLTITRVEAGGCGGPVPVYTNSPSPLRGDAGPPARVQSPPIADNSTYRFNPPLVISANEVDGIWFNCGGAKFFGTASQ